MIEIIPKQPARFPLQIPFFFVPIVIFVGVLVAFFVLRQLNENTEQTLEELETAVSSPGTQEEQQLEQEMLMIQKRTKDFGALLEKRKDPLAVMKFLEGTTHREVFFTKFDWLAQEQKLVLSGETTNFQTLEEQMLIWSQSKEIAKIQLLHIGLGKTGRAVFQGELTFSPVLFER